MGKCLIARSSVDTVLSVLVGITLACHPMTTYSGTLGKMMGILKYLQHYVMPIPVVRLSLSSMSVWDMFRSVWVGTLCDLKKDKTLKDADGECLRLDSLR